MTQTSIDRIVLGTAGLAGIWGVVDMGESEETLLRALEAGIRSIDTAPAYADAERLVGNALRRWKGDPPSLSTKAGRKRSEDPDKAVYDYRPEAIRDSLLRSLETLGVDAVDVLFLHDPGAIPREEVGPAIEAMHRLTEEGLAGNIGIGGNFEAGFLPHAQTGGFTHFMGYNRLNLVRQDAAHAEYPALASRGMEIWQASPLYMGLLGRRLPDHRKDPPPWIPEDDVIRAVGWQEHCEREGLSLPGLALNFVLHHPSIDRMVIGASRMRELTDTLDRLGDERHAEAAKAIIRSQTHDGGTPYPDI